MADYSLVTAWELDAPIDAVWETIVRPERWNREWKYVDRVVELQPGDAKGVGAIHRYFWKTALPYTLAIDVRTTRVEKPTTLEVAATGELEGTGRWSLREGSRGTIVRYDWNVRTTKSWMNLLAPIARPAFAWNHAIVMAAGGEALARTLGATLLSSGGVEARNVLSGPDTRKLMIGSIALALSIQLVRRLWERHH